MDRGVRIEGIAGNYHRCSLWEREPVALPLQAPLYPTVRILSGSIADPSFRRQSTQIAASPGR